MFRIITLAILLTFSISVSAQKNSILKFHNPDEVEVISKKEILSAIAKTSKLKSKHLTLRIGNRENWTIDLQPIPIPKTERLVSVIGKTGILASQHNVKRYSGSIHGSQQSKVRVVSSPDFFSAVITLDDEQYIIEPNPESTKSTSDLILYQSKNLKQEKPLQCTRTLLDNIESKVDNIIDTQRRTKSVECSLLDLALATDYSMYQDAGEDIDNVISYLYALTDIIEQNYASFNIQFNISAFAISTCESCDPWSHTDLITVLLPEFKSWVDSDGFSADFDIAGLWTTRSWSVPAAGLAYIRELCKNSPYFVATKFSSNSPFVAAMVTHELGHIFGCRHNYESGSSCDGNVNRDPLFMDPYISTVTSGWSTEETDCSQNSHNIISSAILATDCAGSCPENPCEPVSAIVHGSTGDVFNLSWQGSAPEYRVRIKALNSTTDLIDQIVLSSSFTTSNLAQCEDYSVTINSICANNFEGPDQSLIITASYESKINFLSANVVDCSPGIEGHYDVEFIVQHQGGSAAGFEINLGGQTEVFAFVPSSDNIQIVQMQGLNNDGNINTSLSIQAVGNNSTGCGVTTSFPAPNEACDIMVRETFNFCELPFAWISETTNDSSSPSPYEWKFGGTERPILNYGSGANAASTLTKDGSCMAYFDDDAMNHPDYTGTISLVSQVFDLANSDASTLTFSYNFHNFSDGKPANGSFFRVDVFDGTQWTQVHEDTESDCPWFDVWSCFETVTIDLAVYANEDLQMRFVYSDGDSGSWTGMIALDDFVVETAFSTVLPLDLVQISGHAAEFHNELEWNTLNEYNLEEFVIERSNENLDFQEIGAVGAHNKQSNQYSYSDEAPMHGQSLYRLKIKDRDGSFKYSETFVIERSESQTETKLYPNPVSDNYLHFTHTKRISKAYIFQLDGRLVAQENIGGTIGKMDLSNLHAGSYVLKLVSDTDHEEVRFIKL